MTVRKFAHTLVVRDEDVRRTTAVDLLEWHEEKAITELVRAVHKAGYAGMTWPRVGRVPMVLMDGELRVRQSPRENVYEWHVTAQVEAMPR